MSVLLCPLSMASAQNLDSKLSVILKNSDAAGFSVVAIKDRRVAYSGFFGKRDIKKDLPTDSLTLYRIASVSKSFTATGIMQLYQKGLLGLDDDISRYFGFKVRNPMFPNDIITFRMLLNHTSSLTDRLGYSFSYPVREVLFEGASHYSDSLFSSHRPGSFFSYCNLGYGLLGTLIEKISNERFDIYIKKHILEKLSMNSSFNILDFSRKDIKNLAVLYRKPDGLWTPQADNYQDTNPTGVDFKNYKIGENATPLSPTGGLRTSALDLAKFMLFHMKGNREILSDSCLAIMHRPGWVFNGSNGETMEIFQSYGCAFNHTTELIKGMCLTGITGTAYGLCSDYYYSDDGRFGVVFITNGGNFPEDKNGFYNIENTVFNAVFESLFKGDK